jgi:hypothetical protein
MPPPIQQLDFRRATEADVDAMAEAHRESILQLGSEYHATAILNEWGWRCEPVDIEASLGAVEFCRRHGIVETGRGEVALPSGFRMPFVFVREELG